MVHAHTSRPLRRPAIFLITIITAACTTAGGSEPAASAGSSAAFSNPASAAASVPESAAPSSAPPPTAQPASPAESLAPFACGTPDSGVGDTAIAQITDVRVGTQDGYDRIVFEFSGGVPQYRVDPATPPFFADASGLPIDVSGYSFLRVTLQGGTKVAPDGSVSYSGPTDLQPDDPALVQLVEGGDFEAVSTWYAGLATSHVCFRAFTLSDPARLVIDVRH